MRVGRNTITVVWHAVHGSYFLETVPLYVLRVMCKGCVVKGCVSVSNKLILNSLFLLGLLLYFTRISDRFGDGFRSKHGKYLVVG